MFVLDDTIEKLDVDASTLLKLFRSMRDVQMALPGFPSQEASAYLCQFQAGKSVATFAVFHLQRSGKLAFYRSEPGEVTPAKAEGVMYQGLDFVESMGFLLSDMDLELMADADRAMLWKSLPLFLGCTAEETSDVPAEPAKVASPPKKKKAPVQKPEKEAVPSPAPEPPVPQAEPERLSGDAATETAEGVDELLAAVENLRARRPGVASRKKQAGPTEMKKRCLEFKENLGRILASL